MRKCFTKGKVLEKQGDCSNEDLGSTNLEEKGTHFQISGNCY